MIKKTLAKTNRYFLSGLLIVSFVGSGALAGAAQPVSDKDQYDYQAKLVKKADKVIKVEAKKKVQPKLKTNFKSAYVFKNSKGKKIKIKPGLSNRQIKKRKKRRKKKREAKRKAKLARQRRVKSAKVSYNYQPDNRSNFTKLYKKAGKRFGIPWQVLAAVHSAETGQSGNTTIGSYAGARGPMQFMPGTWSAYGVDGDGDGVANIYDVDDAVHGAARYLAANGGGSNIRGALYHYNRATWYVNKVVGIAKSWGYRG